jgi:hypothetical protein
MFRGIVFGDFGGIDEGVWVQLWSGTIGAIVSAGVAAWVAVGVLRRSNRKQQELVELQLKEQRKEAEQARRSAVLADLLAAATGFMGASKVDPDAVVTQRFLFQTHAYRWELEGRDSTYRMEIFKWGTVLYVPAFALSKIGSAPEELRSKWTTFLEEVETDFSAGCIGMGFVSDANRSMMLGIMQEQRGALLAKWEAIMDSAEAEIASRVRKQKQS